MAKKVYRAVTRIEHGVAGPDGVEVERKIFNPGDPVRGLDEKAMKQLWDAGSLEEATVLTTMEEGDEAPSRSTTGSKISPEIGSETGSATTTTSEKETGKEVAPGGSTP